MTYLNAKVQKPEILKDQRGKSGIYRWVNKINGKSYVGSAVNLSIRLSQHIIGGRSNILLQQAWRSEASYENFSVEAKFY
jgi:excinuclease UvrABC nuclease subunit